MTFSHVPWSYVWQSWLDPRRPGWHLFSKHTVDIFPEEDSPPLRRTLPLSAHTHFLHLIPMSRQQVARMPFYVLHVRSSGKRLTSTPSDGYVWVNTSVQFMLHAHDLLRGAYVSHEHEPWRELNRYVNLGVALTEPLPPVWDTAMAVTDAAPGSVVESIDMKTDMRAYAVLQALLVADSRLALFEAHILGSGAPGTLEN